MRKTRDYLEGSNMNEERIANLRNKLQPIKTFIELSKEGKEIPKEFIELASKHVLELEELIEGL